MDLDNLALIGNKFLYLRLRIRARYSSSCPRSTLLQVAKERLCTMSSLPSLLQFHILCNMTTQQCSIIAQLQILSFLIVNNKIGIEVDLKAVLDIDCFI
jgi:hypothetical protein